MFDQKRKPAIEDDTEESLAPPQKSKKITEEVTSANLFNWRKCSFVGVSVGSAEPLKNEPFEFPELTAALTDGFLSNRTYPLYMFLSSHMVEHTEGRHDRPYFVVIDGDVDRRAFDGIPRCAVQGGTVMESIEEVNMSWDLVPNFENLFALTANAPIEEILEDVTYEHRVPYIALPQVIERRLSARLRNASAANFTYQPADKEPVAITWRGFPIKDDEIHTLVEETNEDREAKLDESNEISIRIAACRAIQAARAKEHAEYQFEQDFIASFGEQKLRALKTYKFYASHLNKKYDQKVHSHPLVNRFYKNASEVFPKDILPASVPATKGI